jgi:hypothetical protein
MQVILSTLKGCQTFGFANKVRHPSMVRPEQSATGGLRFAATSGYFLTTLRVANGLPLVSHSYDYCIRFRITALTCGANENFDSVATWPLILMMDSVFIRLH